MQTEQQVVKDINAPRIEVKTLAQRIDGVGDAWLAELMNAGWELLCEPQFTSVFDVRIGVQHYEIVKLMRLVGDEDGGGEDVEEASPPAPLPRERGIEMLVGIAQAIRDPEATHDTKELPPSPPVRTSPPARLREEERGEGHDPRPPIIPYIPDEVFTGTIIGLEDDATDPERKPLDEVTYSEALNSNGKYTPEEISAIGNREAIQIGMDAHYARQTWGTQSWDSQVMRLPSARVIAGVAT